VAENLEFLRGLVYSRSIGYCEKCGKQLGDSWALHHRKLRSRGGKDEVTNFLALHHECHNLATDSVHNNPKKATEMGYMVPSWADPAECPVILPNGSTVILTPMGTYKYLQKKEGW
jgi:HNH endonuclease